MITDPIVEEVRKNRRLIEDKCREDNIDLMNFYREAQKKHSNRLVRRKPKHKLPLNRTG